MQGTLPSSLWFSIKEYAYQMYELQNFYITPVIEHWLRGH